MKYSEVVALSEVRRLLNEQMESLSGPNARKYLVALKRFQRKETDPWSPRYWEPWGETQYGGKKTVQLLKKRIGGSISLEAQRILGGLQTTEQKSTAIIQCASVKEMGFNSTVSLAEMNNRILEIGFELLTLEIGFNFYDQFLSDMEYKEYFTLAMKPIEIRPNMEGTFTIITNSSQKELSDKILHFGDEFGLDDEFFFKCPDARSDN